jgi:predicted DNA-binding transcriptional regulator AlpA
MPTDRLLWTTRELAALLKVSPSTLLRWARDSETPLPFRPIRTGGEWVWPAAAVAATLDKLQERAERGRTKRRY